MGRHTEQIAGQLDLVTDGEVSKIRREIDPIRGAQHKLRFIYNYSSLANEWLTTSDLVVITGLRYPRVYSGILALRDTEEVVGKSRTYLEHFESFRYRRDNAAKILLALAGIELGCEPDEVQLAALLKPDVTRTELDGTEKTIPASGFFFRRSYKDESGDSDSVPADEFGVDLAKV